MGYRHKIIINVREGMTNRQLGDELVDAFNQEGENEVVLRTPHQDFIVFRLQKQNIPAGATMTYSGPR